MTKAPTLNAIRSIFLNTASARWMDILHSVPAFFKTFYQLIAASWPSLLPAKHLPCLMDSSTFIMDYATF